MRGWWRWALVGPDGVAPSRMVSVFASVNLSLHHKVQSFSSGTGSPGWSRRKGRKTAVCVCVCVYLLDFNGAREDNRGRYTDSPAGRHPLLTNQQATSISPPFYVGCPSCRNPPNLSWLGTGTKYAGLHTPWLVLKCLDAAEHL